MDYDVIVAGAGPGGMTAALAAARGGAKVLLIDMNGYLGGMNTAGMVGPLMTFHSGDKQIVRGIAQEIVERLQERKGCLGHVPDPIGMVSTITPIEPELLKQLYFEMAAAEPNLTLLLHTFVSGVVKGNGRIRSVTCVNKSGTVSFHAQFFIDATGDGDVAFLAKAKYEEGRKKDGLSQPMTLIFKLGGVHFDKVRRYILDNPEQFILGENVDLDKYVAVSGYFDLVKHAQENQDFSIIRDRVLLFQGVNPGEAFVNMSRILKLRGTDAADLTKAEAEAHRQVDEIIRFLHKYVDGFQECYLVQTAATIGVRESRRFRCRYSLTMNDVLEGRDFEDGVAASAYPVDIHDPKGGSLNWVRMSKDSYYVIPYRVMLPQHIENLLVTGRCIDAEHEAMASSRVSPTVMALGEAAGTAAALAVTGGLESLAEVDISGLRDTLRRNGAVVSKE